MVDMAVRMADPAIPERAATDEDYDFDHLKAVYAEIIAWNENGRPIREGIELPDAPF